MDGFPTVAGRKLAVEHGFECSRLEKSLLAQAYQRIVPAVMRHAGQRTREALMSPRGSNSRLKQTGTVA